MRSQVIVQQKFKDNNDSQNYKHMYISSIFENLDQNNEKYIGIKKILNQITEYEEQEILPILMEINPNVNYDRISEAEFIQLYLRLNLIPENFEKNQIPFTFAGNKHIAVCYKSFPESRDILDNQDELDIMKQLSDLGYGLDAAKNYRLMLMKNANQSWRKVSSDLWQWVQQLKDESSIQYQNSQPKQNQQNVVELNNILEQIQKTDQGINLNIKQFYHHRLYDFNNKQRQQCLKIFKWANLPLASQSDQGTQAFFQQIKQFDETNQHIRAATIASFHFEFDRALDSLNSALEDDPQLRMMKSVLLILKNIQISIQGDQYVKNRLESIYPSNSRDYTEQDMSQEDIKNAKNTNFKNQEIQSEFKNIINNDLRYTIVQNELNFISNLLKDIKFNNPYLTALARFLNNDDPQERVKEIIQQDGIEIFDKIAFALRFLDDDNIITYFTNLVQKAEQEGILECLILVGKDQKAIDIIQAFIDNTRDIQTAGLLSAHLNLHKYEPSETLQNWFKNYKALLNNMNLFEKRITLDKEFKNLKQLLCKTDSEQNKSSFKGSKIFLECKQCNNCLDNKTQLDNIIRRRSIRGYAALLQVLKPMIGVCPSCCVMLPVCCVCLLSCELVNPYIQFNRNRQQQNQMGGQIENLNLEEGIVWCQSCNHGGHYKHIIEWFQDFDVCPVSDCSCKCSVI
ncbi:alpha/beta fold hydrolase (macronuclear) [Tetrahymena thermophila SB210]|uniref:Alpha/beta fold hydrolase n=1 Tax=Tetrahymena thermophila (strain SB210) TaxID=312017 RepID=I7MAW0_TETTS|nr:alpha/beta fold hydrolase [Tetrahymena thermophila SB210]EAS06248.3 alpha/beta fold hydrolase [Tetrahymena thermophila SB210]|eukprot:XP_001026493.3 alpha/beta fold hydrolase [Tetrahymena thermophila SB210]